MLLGEASRTDRVSDETSRSMQSVRRFQEALQSSVHKENGENRRSKGRQSRGMF